MSVEVWWACPYSRRGCLCLSSEVQHGRQEENPKNYREEEEELRGGGVYASSCVTHDVGTKVYLHSHIVRTCLLYGDKHQSQ